MQISIKGISIRQLLFSSFLCVLDDSCVKLWDLRKLKNFKTLQLEDGYEVRDLCFDSSGGNSPPSPLKSCKGGGFEYSLPAWITTIDFDSVVGPDPK